MQSENTFLNAEPEERGLFIVIEGLEGAGKSSALSTIKAWIEEQGISNIVETREPGGTPLAEKMRSLVKEVNTQEQLSSEAELLLMYASRVQLVKTRILPALEAGAWVLGDRHDLSSQAYQGGGRGLDRALIAKIKQAVLGDFKPDFTLYLDIEPKLGLARASQRGELDRIELEQIEFFERTRQCYLELANADASIAIVDASQSMEQVAQDIVKRLEQWKKRAAYFQVAS